jgi:hypothetical protein
MAQPSRLSKQSVGDVSSLLGALFGLGDEMLSSDWLQSPLSIAPASGMAAIARGRAVAWKRMDLADVEMHLTDVYSGTGVQSSPDDRVTAIQWIEVDRLAGEPAWEAHRYEDNRVLVALALGFQSGMLLIIDVHGDLRLAHLFHAAPVRGFKLRGYGTSDGTQELLAIFEDRVVVRFDSAALVLLLSGGAQEKNNQVDHAKWQLTGQGVVCDVVCCGVDPQVCLLRCRPPGMCVAVSTPRSTHNLFDL